MLCVLTDKSVAAKLRNAPQLSLKKRNLYRSLEIGDAISNELNKKTKI